jgi:hypothetical protein
VPAWQLLADKKTRTEAGLPEEELRPVAGEPAPIEAVLARVEYRGAKAVERAQELLTSASPVVFARSPNDLPALLRTADQLLTLSKVDAGERAQLWRCSCGTRYAVPVSSVRPVSLRCERCGNTVELDPAHSLGESNIADPEKAKVSAARLALADFFREAMARGWPVLVTHS